MARVSNLSESRGAWLRSTARRSTAVMKRTIVMLKPQRATSEIQARCGPDARGRARSKT